MLWAGGKRLIASASAAQGAAVPSLEKIPEPIKEATALFYGERRARSQGHAVHRGADGCHPGAVGRVVTSGDGGMRILLSRHRHHLLSVSFTGASDGFAMLGRVCRSSGCS